MISFWSNYEILSKITHSFKHTLLKSTELKSIINLDNVEMMYAYNVLTQADFTQYLI